MDYKQLSIVELGEILLLDRNNRDAQRELQRKIKAAVANQPAFNVTDYTGSIPGVKQGKLKRQPQPQDIVEDMILDDEVNS